MIVMTNGRQRATPDGTTIQELLNELSLPAERVVVEHNGKPLRRDQFAATMLHTGDRLEIAQMVGGG
ncbi:MAG TPA: sulfur carrier protein ThiS [Candidatus Eremiobacteraceae bacterium]|nr:sulfur carrier protein ThiS [Candidatus Eremiobacteraceae bacterium]